MTLDTSKARWLSAPSHSSVHDDRLELTTDPGTDLWQGTYYGFRIANAPALLWDENDNFTFSVRAKFEYKKQFDQCGILVYLDEFNWFKASIEHEEEKQVRLGSVATNQGYSDWATTDVDPVKEIHYRLSRRGPDFLVEHSMNGKQYHQMRVFHMAILGDTTVAMAESDPPLHPRDNAHVTLRYGVYACSPGNSSFTAHFDNLKRRASIWKHHPQ